MKTQNIIVLCATLFLLFSAKAQDSTNSPSSGPSEKETLEWIQAHISELHFSYSVNGNDTGWSQTGYQFYEVSSVELKNGDLIIIDAHSGESTTILTSGAYLSNGSFSSARKIDVSLGNLLGGQIVKKPLSDGHATFEPSVKTLLQFTGKPKSVSSISSSYDVDRTGSGRLRLDGTEIGSALQNPDEEVKQRVINNQGKQSTDSQFSIPVNPDYAERFKKAFDHLIQLHGGGKPEAF